jgi:replicative DNA helicase
LRTCKKGIEKIDAYNITNILNAREATKKQTETITIPALNELIELSQLICRNSVEEYKLLVKNVLDKAFRRDTYKKLIECENLCFSDDVENVQGIIYRAVEDLICEYQSLDEVKPMRDNIDNIWTHIKKGQNEDNFIDFKFPTLNKYCKISRTDAIIFAAREKRGKSLMLLNCLVDLLDKGKSAIYIDTELDTPLFTMRLISHLAQIEFSKIRDGTYNSSDEEKIKKAIEWIKSKNFTHKYLPIIDDDKIISIVKQYKYKYGVDAVILDYLKGNGDFSMDAYKNSASLGKTTDILKNYIAGELKLFVLSAVQATSTGAIADSAKIIRNCSALIYLERKTQDTIEADGGNEYGNMQLSVKANRNGMIMGDEEYISLTLDGNRCTFVESKQPERREPY